MAWDWVSFICGVALGLVVMWIAAVLATAGAESDRERDKEEHRR